VAVDLKKFGLEPVPKDKLGHWREELAEEGPRPSPVSWHKEAGAGKRGFFDVRWGVLRPHPASLWEIVLEAGEWRRRQKIFSLQPEKVPEWVEDRGRPVKHVQRAQIILLSAERLPVLEIANRIGISRPMVWRWQQRFAEQGIEGLLRTKPVRLAFRQCRRPRCMPWSSAPCARRPVQSPIGPAAPWPRRWVFRCERSSAYGLPISSSRTGSGPSW